MPVETRRGYRIEVVPKQEPHAAAAAPSATRSPDADQTLLIDGKETPYRKTPKGYVIYFTPPASDLMEAAKNYIDTQREK